MTHPLAAVQPRTCVVCGWRALTPAQAHVDDRCETQIRLHLELLADFVPVLRAAVAPATVTVRGLPLRVPVFDLTLPARARPVRPGNADLAEGESITGTLAYWAHTWSQVAPSRGWTPSNNAGSIALWLYEQLHWAVQHGVTSSIDEMAADLRAQVAAARRALDLHAKQPQLTFTAPCRCGEATLRRILGADWIDCTSCKRLYSVAEYGDLVREGVEADQLLYAPQAALVLRVPVERVWKWGSRRLLEAIPDDAGRARYRLSDLRDVLRQTDLHRAGRCEIGFLHVQDDGTIAQSELVEYDAPAIVTITSGRGKRRRVETVQVLRGESRYFGPVARRARIEISVPEREAVSA